MATTDHSSHPSVVVKRDFGFMELPLELRQKIYKSLMVIEGKPLDISKALSFKRARELNVVTFPGQWAGPWKLRAHMVNASSQFLRCNSQIYSEAIDILYKENRFTTKYETAFRAFKTKVGELSFNKICHLEVWSSIDSPFDAASIADQFNSLANLKSFKHKMSRLHLSATRPMSDPPAVAVTDPLLFTIIRPGDLLPGLVDAIASRHHGVKIILDVELGIWGEYAGRFPWWRVSRSPPLSTA